MKTILRCGAEQLRCLTHLQKQLHRFLDELMAADLKEEAHICSLLADSLHYAARGSAWGDIVQHSSFVVQPYLDSFLAVQCMYTLRLNDMLPFSTSLEIRGRQISAYQNSAYRYSSAIGLWVCQNYTSKVLACLDWETILVVHSRCISQTYFIALESVLKSHNARIYPYKIRFLHH